MEPQESNIIELPSLLEGRVEPSLAVALSRLLIVNTAGFIAGVLAGKAFDKVLEMRAQSHTEATEI